MASSAEAGRQERGSRFICCRPARGNLLSCDQTLWRRFSTLLPAHSTTTHTARIRKVVISCFLLPAEASYASVDEFSVEPTHAVAPVFVFPEFCLCDTAVKRLSFGAKNCQAS